MRQATRDRIDDPRPEIGIGRALRKARERRGFALEDASHGTRLRLEYLDALERERFEELPGDVYVRSFLRSYARFLGLNASKVVAVYEAAAGRGRPEPSPVDRAPALAAAEDRHLPGSRRYLPWPLAAAIAVIVLAAAAAVGLLSGSPSTPEPARGGRPAGAPAGAEGVQTDLVAVRDVQIRVVRDGVQAFEGLLEEGEARSFEAEGQIELWIERGRSVRLTVNGVDVGRPGVRTEPYEGTFAPSDHREERSTGSG